MSDKKRLPKVDGINLQTSESIDLYREICERSGKGIKGAPCDWCGATVWELDEHIYTDTVFNIGEDRHHHTIVSPFIQLTCQKCGNRKQFNMELYANLTTQGGI